MAAVQDEGRSPGLLTRLGRLLLSAIFVSGGLDAVRNPGPKVSRVADAGIPRPKLSTQVNGFAMVVAGVALAFGIKPKLAASVLAACLIPTTLAGHRFWELEGKEGARQQIHFLKNLGLLGGLIGVLASRR